MVFTGKDRMLFRVTCTFTLVIVVGWTVTLTVHIGDVWRVDDKVLGGGVIVVHTWTWRDYMYYYCDYTHGTSDYWEC